jgi:hypothetical protein
MYVRLLAETGLIGFFIFIAFLFSVLGDALLALKSSQPMMRYLGIAGLFSWLAVGIYNAHRTHLPRRISGSILASWRG